MQNMMMQETSLTRKIFKSKQDSLHFERKKTNQLDKDFAIINFVHVRSLLPTSQLTTHRNKKGKEKKEKKKERRNWSLPVKNLIRGSDRRSITVSRAGERPGIRVNHVGSIERSNDLRTVCRREKSSAYRDGLHSRRTQPRRGNRCCCPDYSPDYDTRGVAPRWKSFQSFAIHRARRLSARSIDRIDRSRGGRPTNERREIRVNRAVNAMNYA